MIVVGVHRQSCTCGECVHAVNVSHRTRAYWKCDTVAMSHGPGTDLRVSWPACLRYESKAVDQ